jgi:hypothetical protein
MHHYTRFKVGKERRDFAGGDSGNLVVQDVAVLAGIDHPEMRGPSIATAGWTS